MVVRWLLVLTFTAILLLLGLVYYLENSIDAVMSKEKQKELFTRINSSPELSSLFYFTFNQYYPDMGDGALTALLKQVTGNGRGYPCPCRDLYVPQYVHHYNLFTSYIVALETEEQCTKKKCLDFIMNNEEFGMNTRGIVEASRLYYHKKPEQLNEREILELLIIRKAPSLYNPIRNKSKLDKAVKEMMRQQLKQ